MAVNSNYDAVGAALESQYPKRQLYHQKFENDNWWEALLPALGPPLEPLKYFGVKSLNIFIVQKPYGWVDTGGGYEFTWPPVGMNEAFDSRPLDQFASYKTIIYVDTHIADVVQSECPESAMPEMMDRTASAFEEFCDREGFEWGGRITSVVDASYFQGVIDDFYNPGGAIPSYLRISLE